MKKFGILGGSFDPVHEGHIALAQAALQELGLEGIYFIPARQSPFKGHQPQMTPRERLGRLRSALKGQKRFHLYLGEMKRPPPSYTIDTLRALSQRWPGRRWFLILGSDTAQELPRWKNASDILQMATPVLGLRPGYPVSAVPGEVRQKARILQASLPAVSSTERRRVEGVGSEVGLPWTLLRKGRRLTHTRAVARWAVELAQRYGVDIAQARTAALWHDAAKAWNPQKVRAYLKTHSCHWPGFPQVKDRPDLWHGPIAADLARRQGGVKDPAVLEAIAWHTLGRPGLSGVGAVLFVADYSSADRQGKRARAVRRLARLNLRQAVRRVRQEKAAFVKSLS